MPLAPVARSDWVTARGTLRFDRPLIAGILNLTPDSFYDGGLYVAADAAIALAERLLAEGADLLDLGGESTRPGAAPVSAEEEAARVVPLLREILRRWPDTTISVDTVKSDVARKALDAGASIINDVSGLRLDHALGSVVAQAGAGLVLMHSRGTVDRMASYEVATYGEDAVGEIASELSASLDRARRAGVAEESIVLDPGIGFSKRTEQSVAVLAHLDRILELGRPVLVGPSRKRFVGELSGGLPVEDRLEGTIAACVIALFAGARIFRVHDVAPVRRALEVAEAIRVAP
ncbi:MAG: dihydropteroate synthase [Longimicrobiales bacterium]